MESPQLVTSNGILYTLLSLKLIWKKPYVGKYACVAVVYTSTSGTCEMLFDNMEVENLAVNLCQTYQTNTITQRMVYYSQQFLYFQ